MVCFGFRFSFFFGMAYQTFVLRYSFKNNCCHFIFSRSLVVVHFWAPWAPQCAQMNEVMAALAKEHMQVTFVKVSLGVELVLNRGEILLQSVSKVLQNMGEVGFAVPLWLHI